MRVDRLCRAADFVARQYARAISVRQRPPGARQAVGRRGARRLCRLSAARPPSAAGAVRHARSARSRRQRASGQDRSALPRWRAGARADRARAERCAGARRPARGLDRRRRHHRGLPSGDDAAARRLRLAQFAGAAGAVVADRRGNAALGFGGSRRRRPSTSARRRPMRGSKVSSRRPTGRAAARRGARANSRDLYRVADPRRPDHRRPARRA